MKPLLFFTLVLMNLAGYSQYCGNSGTSICNISGTLSQSGFEPTSSNLPALLNGNTSTTVIQFKNYNQIKIGNIQMTINWLRFDSIENLPSGTCWSTNRPDNTFQNQEDGCIKISNISCSAPGQYKLRFKFTANVNQFGDVVFSSDNIGLNYFLRVVNPGATASAVDTSQAVPFVAYGPSAVCNIATLNVSLPASTGVCAGDTVTAVPTVTGGLAPYTYNWSATSNVITCATCTTQTTILNTSSITYRVTVTDANNLTDTASITYNVVPVAFGIISFFPQAVCEGDTINLVAYPEGSSYLWNTDDTSRSIAVSDTGTYSVFITDTTVCGSAAEFVYVPGPNPTDAIIIGDTSVDPFSINTYTVTNDPQIDYSWQVQGGAIQSGQNTNSTTIQWGANGPYSLTLTQTNGSGCTGSTLLGITENTGTDIQDADKVLSAIYPNPSKGVLYLETTNNISSISVKDITGKLVNAYTKELSSNKYALQLNEAGVYFVNVTVNGQTQTQRIVVTK